MRHLHINHILLVFAFSFIFFPHLTLLFHQVVSCFKLIASQFFVFNLILIFACISAFIKSISYFLLVVILPMIPCKRLRASTQVPDTLKNKLLPKSSLSKLLSPGDHLLSPAFLVDFYHPHHLVFPFEPHFCGIATP